jgi:hypothetical protein
MSVGSDGYMNRIRGRVTDIGSSSTDDLQNELLSEMAQSLTTTEDKLVSVLRKLESAVRDMRMPYPLSIDACSVLPMKGGEVEDARVRGAREEMLEAVTRSRELYKEAHQRRQNLLIHRQVAHLVGSCGSKNNPSICGTGLWV